MLNAPEALEGGSKNCCNYLYSIPTANSKKRGGGKNAFSERKQMSEYVRKDWRSAATAWSAVNNQE